MNKWIKKGDNVLVTAGNNRGRKGVVLRRKGDKVVIQGINIRKKHVKRQNKAQPSTIIEMETPIHISNIRPCNEEGKILKLKTRQTKKGKEIFYKQDDKEVVLRSIGKS